MLGLTRLNKQPNKVIQIISYKNALLFGGLSTGGAVLGKAGNYLTKSLPKRLADSALKPSIKELEKTIKYGDKTLGASSS